jgi:hypothetical protein
MAKIDWKKIVGAVAPTLATALGGPLAGIAVKTIATQVLGKSDASEDEVEAAILGADPQTLIRLKEVELEFKATMVNAGIKLEEIASSDRASDLKDPMIATLVGTMIGYTSAKADQIVSYYFGSSASSKAKDETISTIAKME